jgi:hypothetical protein
VINHRFLSDRENGGRGQLKTNNHIASPHIRGIIKRRKKINQSDKKKRAVKD